MEDSPFSKAALDSLVAAELNKPRVEVSAPAPPPEKKGVSKWAQLATLAGHAADAASTIHALRQPGLREGNPIFGDNPSAGKIAGVKAGGAALQMLLQHYIGKRAPKATNIIGFGTGAALGGLAAHNMIQANKARNGGS